MPSPVNHPGACSLEPPRPAREAGRRLLAAGLHRASAALDRWSRQIALPAPPAPQPTPRLEFHNVSGAPEGALYVDGRLVGWIYGVTRL